jgi:6-pyruvoyltetrahydropterin/6-carboxytetrahydropterin synthase
MPTSLTRVVSFRATHRFWLPDWPEERNRETFGQLTEPHEHHYTCRVTVAGRVDPRTGMLVDVGQLDRILEEEILTPFEGRDLNREVPAFAHGAPLPTCEVLARYLFSRLAPRIPKGARLERVAVEEDPTLSGECTGLE